jgi:GntR family transcriptional regulator, transcriptional repressor for pyruvate dehydrogenase complex
VTLEDGVTFVDWAALRPRAVRLSESVAARIEAMIVSGELQPGGRLPSERRLAELLGVSRGLVREAIHELALKGLVLRRQGRGTIVRTPYRSEFTGAIVGYMAGKEREILELLDFREALEPPIAARAAERATAKDIQRLQQFEEALKAESEPERAADLDASFHHAIALATRNDVLVKLVETSMEVLNLTRLRNLQTPARRRLSHEAHHAIFEAIRVGDAIGSERAMTEHIRGLAAFVVQENAALPGGARRWSAESGKGAPNSMHEGETRERQPTEGSGRYDREDRRDN